MVIDLAGRSGFIDAMSVGDFYSPPQTNIMASLSDMGRQAWDTTKTLVGHITTSVSNLLDVRQYLRNNGQVQDDTSVYAITSFGQLLDAGELMRNYMMCHPAMVQAYNQGIDVYPGMTMSRDYKVMYARATDGVVQYGKDDMEYFVETYDVGYDDLHQPTRQDITVLDLNYRYFSTHIAKRLEELLFEEDTE